MSRAKAPAAISPQPISIVLAIPEAPAAKTAMALTVTASQIHSRRESGRDAANNAARGPSTRMGGNNTR